MRPERLHRWLRGGGRLLRAVVIDRHRATQLMAGIAHDGQSQNDEYPARAGRPRARANFVSVRMGAPRSVSGSARAYFFI